MRKLSRIVITPLSYVTFADFWVAGSSLFISTPAHLQYRIKQQNPLPTNKGTLCSIQSTAHVNF